MSEASALPTPADPSPISAAPLGVVLVTYNAADVILPCLETLLGSQDVVLRVVIVDNESSDGTPQRLRDWMARAETEPLVGLPFDPHPIVQPVALVSDLADVPNPQGHAVSLIETGSNLGFAGGVNRGLAALAAVPEIERFWVLNPDSIVPPGTAAAFAHYTPPNTGGTGDTAGTGDQFSLMGGRLLYVEQPDLIQIDGGTISRATGITNNIGLFAPHATTPWTDPSQMDFITGASMVASRTFYETVGPMREDYFLYYEEVDWALRRGDLPLAYCPNAIVYHHAGSAIGSAAPNRPASPFALYFKHRARMMFLRRFFPSKVLSAHAWSLAKAAQFTLKGFGAEARALLAGAFGRPPPAAVAERLSPRALTLISDSAEES